MDYVHDRIGNPVIIGDDPLLFCVLPVVDPLAALGCVTHGHAVLRAGFPDRGDLSYRNAYVHDVDMILPVTPVKEVRTTYCAVPA